MSVRLNQSALLPRGSAARLPDLRWPIGLVAAIGIPFLLPLSSPVGAVAFAIFVAAMIVLAFGWLVALLPVLAATGAYFLPIEAAGINVFGFRLLIIVLALFSTPLTTRADWWSNLVAQRAMFFMVFWILWGLLSIFWGPEPGISDIMNLVFGLGLLLILFSFNTHHTNRIDKLRFGWLIALLLVAVMVGIEMTTGYHLPSTASLSMERYFDGSVVQSTIGHPSAFGGYVLLTLPFILWSLEESRGFSKLFYLALIPLVVALVFLSASRLALGGLFIQLLFYLVMLQRRHWRLPVLVVLSGVALVSVQHGTLTDDETQMGRKLEKATSGDDGSVSHRLALTVNGLWLVYETAGRGIGAGAFESATERRDLPMDLPIKREGEVAGGWEAHNIWVQIASEYGILIITGLVALTGWIWMLGWRAQRRRPVGPGDDTPSLGRAVLVGLIGYLFFGVTSGSVLIQSSNWMFFASLLIMAASLHDRLSPSKTITPSFDLATRRSTRLGAPKGPGRVLRSQGREESSAPSRSTPGGPH